MTESLRRVAIVGGSRIPFCRSNSIYADKSNLDMLAAAIDGVVDRFDLAGEQIDEVMAGPATGLRHQFASRIKPRSQDRNRAN